MKKATLILIALGIASLASSQTTLESYMKRVPVLPRDSCNITRAAMESFVSQISALIDELDSDIEERGRIADENAEENRSTMEDNVVKQMQQQYGMSDADINSLKNAKNLSPADKQALANKMMMQQTNISMDEAKNMSKMSEAGKKAYAEAYAAEAMATAQVEPKKQTGNENARTMLALTNEQQALINKIQSGQQKIAGMYAAIENDPTGKAILARISKWHEKLVSMMGEVSDSEAKYIDSLSLLITNEHIRYCELFTPKYREVLRQDLANFKASLPDCRRLDEVSGELMKIQTGVAAPPESAETTSLAALNTYLGNLKNAYKYKLYYPEDN